MPLSSFKVSQFYFREILNFEKIRDILFLAASLCLVVSGGKKDVDVSLFSPDDVEIYTVGKLMEF